MPRPLETDACFLFLVLLAPFWLLAPILHCRLRFNSQQSNLPGNLAAEVHTNLPQLTGLVCRQATPRKLQHSWHHLSSALGYGTVRKTMLLWHGTPASICQWEDTAGRVSAAYLLHEKWVIPYMGTGSQCGNIGSVSTWVGLVFTLGIAPTIQQSEFLPAPSACSFALFFASCSLVYLHLTFQFQSLRLAY